MISSKGCAFEEHVAIVGVGCRYPGKISNPSQLWDFLLRGGTGYKDFSNGRFNSAGFYHPNESRPGSFPTRGAFLLDEDPKIFDHGFFGISLKEVATMDPTQRKLLEVVYEAFENAGEPWHTFYGSNTGVFVGNFNHDHMIMQRHDADFPPAYAVTGGSASILSNRISYVFNLKGPSVTLDTACSSSLYALYSAVHAIRNGDCESAIVGGSNLILSAETQLMMSKLGVLSASSTCHSFDDSADGYARADGFAALYLRRLSHAVHQNNPVRAVLRGISVNSNGRTPGITHPAIEGQYTAICRAYAAANIPMDQTGYVECHGTGTPVGDPIEVMAVARAFSSSERQEPLLVGSIKTNLGHSESASGLAGVLKAILSVEHGLIPSTVGITTLNPNIDFLALNVKVVTQTMPWPVSKLRRASVNSFGYGGANAHCIVEHPTILVADYAITGFKWTPSHEPDCPRSVQRLMVLPLSAKSRSVLPKYRGAVQDTLGQYHLRDISHTLSAHRSRFHHRTFALADSTTVPPSLLDGEITSVACNTSRSPNIAFVFTGQGAHWPNMGRGLLGFQVFKESIEHQEEILQTLSFGPRWTISDVLETPIDSLLDHPDVAQTVCTALQIALVDLLRSWNIKPVTNIGHSSGEIAAAYSAGRLSSTEAIVVAYCRGKAVSGNRRKGLMLAVGRSEMTCESIIKSWEGAVTVAAVNSPDSVTLSGNEEAILELKTNFQSEGIFTKLLPTSGQAYHSHHMQESATTYIHLLLQAWNELGIPKDGCRDEYLPTLPWISSVKPQDEVCQSSLRSEYWASNLLLPVQFSGALIEMIGSSSCGVDILVEVGPQAGLRSPITRTLSAVPDLGPEVSVEYFPVLQRDCDSMQSILQLCGLLFMRNTEADLDAANNASLPHLQDEGALCVDFPICPYDYGPIVYHTTRPSRDIAQRQHLRHDLLGAPCPGLNSGIRIWRNILRLKDVPWLGHHVLSAEVVFPASAYLSMAAEASSQFHEILSCEPDSEVAFRDVKFQSQMTLEAAGDGVEVQLRLHRSNTASSWLRFTISSTSVASDSWTDHCIGLVKSRRLRKINQNPLEPPRDPRSVSTTGWYDTFKSCGLEYGPSFRALASIKSNPFDSMASADIPQDTTEAMFSGPESTYSIHPTSLDMGFQLGLISCHGGQRQRMGHAFVPVEISEMCISHEKSQDSHDRPSDWKAIAHGELRGLRAAYADIQLIRAGQTPYVTIKGLRCLAHLQKSMHPNPNLIERPTPYSRLVWKPDITSLDQARAQALFPPPMSASQISPLFEQMDTLTQLMVDELAESFETPEACLPGNVVAHFLAWANRHKNPNEKASSHQRSNRRSHIEGIAAAHEDTFDFRFVKRMYDAMPSIIRGAQSGLEVALKDGDLKQLYLQSLGITGAYVQLKRIVDVVAHSMPRLRILEVGAGTGGATRVILDILCQSPTLKRYATYTFTDVSSAFLTDAAAQFRDYDHITYNTFDVEEDPFNQGLDSEYDLIIASQSLHAAKDLKHAASNLRKLLAPNGKLVLVEAIQPRLSHGIILGTLPGYWNAVEDFRKDSLFVDLGTWERILKTSGFSGIDISLPDYPAPHTIASVIVSSPSADNGPSSVTKDTVSTGEKITIVTYGAQTQIADKVSKALVDQGLQVAIKPLCAIHEVEASRTIFLLAGYEQDLVEISHEDMQALKNFIQLASSALWVTSGGILNGQRPEASLAGGLARVLRNEITLARYSWLDVEPKDEDSQSVVDAIIYTERLLRHAASEEREWALADGVLYISRLVPYTESQSPSEGSVSENANGLGRPLASVDKPYRIDFKKPGILDSLYFRQDHIVYEPLPDDFIEIATRAVGMNWKDLTVCSGRYDLNNFSNEASGVVVRTGKAVKEFSVGDKVYGFLLGNFGNIMRGNSAQFARIPPEMTFVDAATIPVVYGSAVHALVHLARLEAKERVLIQSASGGLGLAALQVAKWLGAEIYATVGNVEKANHLADCHSIPGNRIFSSRDQSPMSELMAATKYQGFDVVLSSSSGEMMTETWRCIARGGRFIDVGRTDVHEGGSLPLGVFQRDATYASFDMTNSLVGNPKVVKRILAEVSSLIERRAVSPISPVTTFPIDQIHKALLYLGKGAHLGKVVVTYNGQEDIKMEVERPRVFFHQSGAYIIAGGFGGLGRSIVRWLSERGARNLIILSRSTTRTPHAKVLIQSLISQGVNVEAITCDVAQSEDVHRAVTYVARRYVVRGVFHSAVSLQDMLFSKLTYTSWNYGLAAKVKGTRNLHESTLHLPLDFFVMASSIQTLMAQATQTVYCAANSFQDAFARYRRSLGLPALTLAFGLIDEVDGLGQTDVTRNAVMRNRIYPTGEFEFLNLFEGALTSNPRCDSLATHDQMAMGNIVACLDPTRLAEQEEHARTNGSKQTLLPSWHSDPAFRHTLLAIDDHLHRHAMSLHQAPPTTISAGDTVDQMLADGNRLGAHAYAVHTIMEKIADLMFTPRENLSGTMTIVDLGVDSLIRVELEHWCFQSLSSDSEVLKLLAKNISIDTLATAVIDTKAKGENDPHDCEND